MKTYWHWKNLDQDKWLARTEQKTLEKLGNKEKDKTEIK